MSPSNDEILLVPVEEPSQLDRQLASPPASLPPLTPEKILFLYDNVAWEEFVREWATTLKEAYAKILRNGGANDHGVDIAGFASEHGFDGTWDCYQCKHYSKALNVSDAFPEILKIILGVIDGHYTWPRKYRFAAPKGYSTSLANVIYSPSKLKKKFLEDLYKDRSPLARELSEERLAEAVGFVDDADFSVFGTLDLSELIEQHAETRWHSVRFGTPLPERPPNPQPGKLLLGEEQRYIEKLILVYRERHPSDDISSSSAHAHPSVKRHYTDQRVAFYNAEALRVFARDAVPEGTFERLQNEIYDGVVDTHELDHPSGWMRLHEVMMAARSLSLTANRLIPVLEVSDRTGICHQLANEDRLDWCHGDSK